MSQLSVKCENYKSKYLPAILRYTLVHECDVDIYFEVVKHQLLLYNVPTYERFFIQERTRF